MIPIDSHIGNERVADNCYWERVGSEQLTRDLRRRLEIHDNKIGSGRLPLSFTLIPTEEIYGTSRATIFALFGDPPIGGKKRSVYEPKRLRYDWRRL